MSLDFIPFADDPDVVEERVRSLVKPSKGSQTLAREEDRAQADAIERREKGAAKKRDGKCRWPEPHKCRGQMEAAHIVDASLGGPMHRANLVLFCAWIHRNGPESIHGKSLKVETESAAGAEGALSFWRRVQESPLVTRWYLVAREIRPFQYERD
jgi:hypothetical protein